MGIHHLYSSDSIQLQSKYSLRAQPPDFIGIGCQNSLLWSSCLHHHLLTSATFRVKHYLGSFKSSYGLCILKICLGVLAILGFGKQEVSQTTLIMLSKHKCGSLNLRQVWLHKQLTLDSRCLPHSPKSCIWSKLSNRRKLTWLVNWISWLLNGVPADLKGGWVGQILENVAGSGSQERVAYVTKLASNSGSRIYA